jgi:8-oxo-dGTP pyrophosphatase MutT (NUDIX family)
MITVFCPGKTIQLSSQQGLFRQSQDNLLLKVNSEAEMKKVFDEHAEKKGLRTIFFYHPDESRLMDYFSSMFRVIVAAGGLVKNARGEYLFIFRHGRWDLPKGKVEQGEDVRHAAIREVQEECGVTGLSNLGELMVTYHVYPQAGEMILKPTHWFRMITAATKALVPQTEEGITAVKWLSRDELEMVRENTFPSVLEVIRHC